jgi:fused signal recognition particle receptor
MFSKWFSRNKDKDKKPEDSASSDQSPQAQPSLPDVVPDHVSAAEFAPALEPTAPVAQVASDAAPTSSIIAAIEPHASKLSFRERLKQGLQATRSKFTTGLAQLFGGGAKLDEDTYEALETLLLSADVGVAATEHLLNDLRKAVREQNLTELAQVKQSLKASLTKLVGVLESPLTTNHAKPFVMMMVGVNGAGKTTSIGKLAKYFQSEGKSVLLAAGDTFRAAAREQLVTWGDRNGVTVIAQESGDSAAVIFDAVQSARAKQIDIVLADTAGRLPTQLHLMEEIKKVKRVIAKAEATAPHEIMLTSQDISSSSGPDWADRDKAGRHSKGRQYCRDCERMPSTDSFYWSRRNA